MKAFSAIMIAQVLVSMPWHIVVGIYEPTTTQTKFDACNMSAVVNMINNFS
eukprot:m.192654 g.192654  ORF g.192654 m.192654 type:complete len:51 (-) comp15659_c0_seq3:46-198(-)